MAMRFKAGAIASAVVAATFFSSSAWAQEQERQFDIPTQSAATGVAVLGQQAGVQVLAAHKALRGKQTGAVRGTMSVDQAFAALLANTGLTAKQTGAKTYTVVPMQATATKGGPETGEVQAGEVVPEVVVTGTNIRGEAALTSPLQSYSHQEIEDQGNVTLAQFARTLPQNFNSTNGETAALGNVPGASKNGSFAAGFDLRGFGAGSTLVLINGRRVAPSGSDGSFVDISAIPLAAINRVDVVTDGSSAIYGADAVGGVVNIVLRDHYQGAETSVYSDVPTNGGGSQIGVSQLIGKSWGSGSVMIAADYDKTQPVYASQRNFVPPTTYPLPYMIAPRNETESVFGNVNQQLSDRISLFLDGSYSHRTFEEDTSLLRFIVSHINGDTTSYATTGGADIKIGSTWFADLSGSYAGTKQESNDVGSGFFTSLTTANQRTTLGSGEIKIGGDTLQLPGGALKVVMGYERRYESFDSADNYHGALLSTSTSLARNVDGLFGEASLPLVDDSNAVPGLRKLLLSAAIRYDHYSDAGGATSPKLGALWSPVSDLSFRGTWGRSFRPPLLSQLDPAGQSFELTPFPKPSGGDINTLYAVGSNPLLVPERSTSISVGMDVKPKAIPGLDVSIDYFNIDYRNRIAPPPVLGSQINAFYDASSLGQFLSYPANPAFVAAAYATGRVRSTSRLTESDVQATFDDRLNNIARSKTSGLQFNATYSFGAGVSQFVFGVNGNWIFDLKEQSTATSSYVELADTEFEPAKFRMNATVGWHRGPLSVSTVVRYVGSYNDTLVRPFGRVGYWLTDDLNIAYDLGKPGGGHLLSGFRVALSVLNIADTAPPVLHASPTSGILNNGYDPANASGIGRTISLRLTKSW